MKSARYTYQRVDTSTRIRREALEAVNVGWGIIPTARPQFAIFDGERLADWPLLNSIAESEKDCAEFNAPDGERSERVWQARMGGDLEVF